MWWVIGIAVIILYYKMEDVLEILKKKDPEYQKNKHKEKKIEIEEKHKLVDQLKANIGNVVTIKSDDLIYTNQNNMAWDMSELTGKILEIDEDWINLEYRSKKIIKKECSDHFIFRTDSIKSFTSLSQ
ncbi:hypothetical protein [Proteiniclasticum ruminis]|uniref:Uncharacterized protein n=1 Tax=Proteiniclasticum ruminis TaxID=398199 RepID=A0A1I5F4S7_9CLOT|nr:hypothetical protein [Proteiniclasticum ruminis]SFO18301.1 hypothetical protein SAMN04488695_1285 [Proteiniclasticum ruminis]